MFTKSGKTAASSGSGAASRRIGAAFKPALLSKKSASVDSLHYCANGQGTATDELRAMLAGRTDDEDGSLMPKQRRSMRYDHVQSKVKAIIDTQREEDNRRRSLKFQRHRSMPESLCGSHGNEPSAIEIAQAAITVDAVDDVIDGRDPAAKLAELRATLQQKDQQLAEMEIVLRTQKTLFYESSRRDSDDRLKLEHKVDTMRLELLQANDERHHCLEKLQHLQQQQQKLKEPMASSCSLASAATSTASTTSLSTYPPSSTVGSSTSSSSRHREGGAGSRGGHINVSYGLASSSGGSSASAAATYAAKPAYRHDAHLGLHHRPTFKLTVDDGGRSSGIGNTSGSSASSCVLHAGRPIIMHSSNSDYRLLGSATEDDDIVLFEKSPGDCPIITSSSMSHDLLTYNDHVDAADDDDADAANYGFAMPMGSRWYNAADGSSAFRRQRLGRAIRKRLRRMWRRCTPCLSNRSHRGRCDGHANRYDEDISMLYAGLDDGDETAAMTTTGYSSF